MRVTVWAHGLGLDRPLHAVSTRPAAVRADKIRATRRTSTSYFSIKGETNSPVECERSIQADRDGRAGDLTRLDFAS
jgi:hypothetical protein